MTHEGNLLDLDVRDYVDTWNLQRKLVDLRTRGMLADTLVLVQHPHIFTVGKAVPGDLPHQIGGVPVLRVERGGKWTYHGPKQLVGYPILDLSSRERDIHRYLRNIEETIILTLDEFRIGAGRREGQTGVWVRDKKVASIGAAVRNWTTFHGFALNVNTDLSYFTLIEPCGMPSSSITSMKEILRSVVDFEVVRAAIVRNFETIFELQLTELKLEKLSALILV
jgi:lipoate-protein ligase B